jgi:hypothetical protein
MTAPPGRSVEKKTVLHVPSRLRVLQYILFFISLVTVAPAFALEMSSKRDCVVCHIMWLNDFRTDKETLIKWEPANVLMKDTQGVVSI